MDGHCCAGAQSVMVRSLARYDQPHVWQACYKGLRGALWSVELATLAWSATMCVQLCKL